MSSTGLILGIYTIRMLVVFADFWIAFDNFFDLKKKKWKSSNLLWIAFYVLITYAYRPMINYGPRFFYFPMIILYLVRIIPFFCAKYGFKPGIIFAIPFYEYLTDCIAQNIRFIFAINNLTIPEIYSRIGADISITFAECLLLILLLTLSMLERENIVRIKLTQLTAMEYMILFITCMIYGGLEVRIFNAPESTISTKIICMIVFVFLLMMIANTVTVRKENSSMNLMIGNLKEPMKQITESYIEMNEKNTELRRFRHDTKNLLIALRSLVSEGKNDQALEYIDKMQTGLDIAKIKMFETGNHIADALLESKAKTAHRYGIKISIEGNIPSGNIEDVDLVILLSNLLDNAIEASIQADGDKFIEIRSILKKNIWILNVKNPCDKEVIIKDNRIESTKDDNEAHGFGLANIERITSKYNGRLQLSFEDHIFTATATVVSEE